MTTNEMRRLLEEIQCCVVSINEALLKKQNGDTT